MNFEIVEESPRRVWRPGLRLSTRPGRVGRARWVPSVTLAARLTQPPCCTLDSPRRRSTLRGLKPALRMRGDSTENSHRPSEPVQEDPG